jgi:hypothetical protein
MALLIVGHAETRHWACAVYDFRLTATLDNGWSGRLVAGARRQANKPPARYPCAALNIFGDGGLHYELVFVFGRIFVFLFISLG